MIRHSFHEPSLTRRIDLELPHNTGDEMAVIDQAGPGPGAESPRGLFWETPDLYGEAEALNSMGTIAAPLLAGFSLAAMAQTLTIKTSETRWPDVALLLFMLAAVLFVTSVTYSAALLCLLAALTLLAIPPASEAQTPIARWLAVAVGTAAFMAETVWTVGSFTNAKWLAWLLQPPYGDASNGSPTGPHPEP
jgi:hypothetical protein